MKITDLGTIESWIWLANSYGGDKGMLLLLWVVTTAVILLIMTTIGCTRRRSSILDNREAVLSSVAILTSAHLVILYFTLCSWASWHNAILYIPENSPGPEGWLFIIKESLRMWFLSSIFLVVINLLLLRRIIH